MPLKFNKEQLRSLILSVVSAVLLILSYPRTDIWICAWFGLVPMFFAIEGKSAGASFGYCYFVGLLFFWGTLYWFVNVTIIGAACLIAYLSLYFGIFGWGYNKFSTLKIYQKALILPSLWVVCEYLRAHLFTGFDWAGLGHSQYKNLMAIQIADLTGVFGISFILVMFNFLVKEGITLVVEKKAGCRKEHQYTFAFGVLVLAMVLCYGAYSLKKERALKGQAESQDQFTVGIVQSNTPQDEKWKESSWPWIMEEYLELTEQVARMRPDLIIWPETSFPGFLWEDVTYFVRVRDYMAEQGIPLLFGSVTHEEDKYYNSSILLSGNGDVTERYNKLHLVPFGEFLPLRGIIPYLADFVPIEDFSRGTEWTLFSLTDDRKNTFSTLICFEDTVANLARQFVLSGSRLLVNVTNDAWFKDTKAPYMHLQSSVFRSVENRRYLVRAANTGVSSVIDPAGRIVASLKGKNQKETYVKGWMTEDVQYRKNITPYTKFGDVFTFLCIFCTLWGVGLIIININRNSY